MSVSARKDHLSWDEAFMRIAEVIAGRSKDPNTQVGACIVASDNRVLSLGYNGTPRGFHDDLFPWSSDSSDELDTKYPFVVHAERNAVLNFRGNNRELEGATVYVTHYPCNECAKELAQAGISRVIYLNEAGRHFNEAARIIMDAAGIEVRQGPPLRVREHARPWHPAP